jgi:hypothetical protein
LLNRYTGKNLYRGFESLRQSFCYLRLASSAEPQLNERLAAHTDAFASQSIGPDRVLISNHVSKSPVSLSANVVVHCDRNGGGAAKKSESVLFRTRHTR